MRIWIVLRTIGWNEASPALFSSREKAEAFIQKKKMWTLGQGREWSYRYEYYELENSDGILLDDPVLENQPWFISAEKER